MLSEHTGSDISLRCGVDLVAISRIQALLDEFPDSFRKRGYTPAERRYCDQQPDPPQHYAARWAAKEAFLKAVSPGSSSLHFRDIAVVHVGADPRLRLTDRAHMAAVETVAADSPTQLTTAVSLSHDRTADHAIGQVLLRRGDCP